MQIQRASPENAEAIRRVARESLEASYDFLDEETISDVVSNWYADDALDELIDAKNRLFLVAVENDTVVGFSQNDVIREPRPIGEVRWLHVSPDRRGSGVGTKLFERTQDELVARGAERLRGAVLTENEDGNRFYRNHGFELVGTRTVDIAGEVHEENVYGYSPEDEVDWELTDEAHELPDGEMVYVAYGESEAGSRNPFYAVYRSPDRDRRYGWFCSNCESADTAMDSMERIVCNQCGNVHKATRWDDTGFY